MNTVHVPDLSPAHLTGWLLPPDRTAGPLAAPVQINFTCIIIVYMLFTKYIRIELHLQISVLCNWVVFVFFSIPVPCHAPLIQVLYGDNRDTLDDCALANRPRFSTVEEFNWRVDVGISTTSLKRVLEPSILCNVKTSKNENRTFEVSCVYFALLESLFLKI